MTQLFCEEHCILFLNHRPFLSKIVSRYFFVFTVSSPLFRPCFNHRCLSEENAMCANILSKRTTVFFLPSFEHSTNRSLFLLFLFLLYSRELNENKMFLFSLWYPRRKLTKRELADVIAIMSDFHKQLGPFKGSVS